MKTTTDIDFWQLYVDNAGLFHAFIASPATWRHIELYSEEEIATLLHKLRNNELRIADIDNYYTPSADQEEITRTLAEKREVSSPCRGIAWSYEPAEEENI